MEKLKSKITLALVIATAALCFSPPKAEAQQLTTVINNSTVPGALSNSLSTVTAAFSKDVAVQIRFKLMAAGTDPVAFYFDSSNDNQNWKTTTHLINVTAAGTAEVLHITNLVVNAVPYLRFRAHNTNSAIVTNLYVTTVTKRGL